MDARTTTITEQRGVEDDAVALFTEHPWCCVCRRSIDVKWVKHAFTKSHQQRAAEFLEQRVIVLTELLVIPDGTSGTGVLQTLATRKWGCGFCELHDLEGWSACVDHFASDTHRKKLEAFCRHHRCDVNRKLRAKLQLTPGKHRQLKKASAALQQQEMQLKEHQERAAAESALACGSHAVNKGLDASAMRAEAFLSSAAARLQQVQTKRQTSVASPLNQQQMPGTGSSTKWMAPKLPTEVTRVKTVVSSDGIVQNPLGVHDGRRVWGGGIVKLRKPNEWIPWPIDVLVKEENDRSAAGGSGRKYQDADSEQGDHAEGKAVSFTHRVTDMAFGAGLGRISKVAWGDSVANVHTDAVPPWMVQSEDEYKRCNERQPPVYKSTYGGESGDSAQPMWTQQIGRHQNGPSAHRATSVSKPTARVTTTAIPSDGGGRNTQAPEKHDPNWLPNFGGVWQEGPRSKTKHEFSKTMPLATASSGLQFRPASVYQRRRKAAIVSTLLPSLMAPSPPQPEPPSYVAITTEAEPKYQQSQQHSQPTQDESNQSKPTEEALVLPPPSLPPAEKPPVPATPMDEKRRLLLAQKERLRAKIAAKRAPGR